MDWVRDFFDDGYRFLYGDMLSPERTEFEVAGLVQLTGLREGARVLDLCCGDGRHSVPLQRRGHRVTGVDLSRKLLTRAQQRAERVLPEDQAPPVWIEADARKVPVRDESFTLAICLFNSIGYGTDDDTRAMLGAARRAIEPNGAFVLECTHRDFLVREATDGRTRRTVQVSGVPVEFETWIDAEPGLQPARMACPRNGQRFERKPVHRMFTLTALFAMLRAAGFHTLDAWGDYDARPFSIAHDKVVIRARP
ncbi:MAG: class I SAM-dependent methyltransferase [Deltaproteobacteria bacterium]|nr:class I SAM-dependent methyltransferase [Deltaproteobacteria bacterium]